jgi:hypothetical protein
MGVVQNEPNLGRAAPAISEIIHRTRIAEALGVQRPEQHQKKQNAFETVMSRTWPIKMLGLLLAIVAVVLMSEILSVLLNLPEDNVGVLRRFE